MSTKRVQSAGLFRSPSNHISYLNSEICRLEEEAAQYKAENQRTNDKLNCLISLVKNAWNGDRAASIHVAKIVGAAPPEIDVETTENNTIVLTAKPKPKALNNWALLTIGLLNREYKKIEMSIAKEQNLRLEQRRLYLEEQLIENRHSKMAIVPPNSPRTGKRDEQQKTTAILQNHEKTFTKRHRAGSAPVTRPRQIRVNRPASAQKHLNVQPVYVADLIVRPTTNHRVDEAFQAVHDLTKCVQKKRIIPQNVRRFSAGSESEVNEKIWTNPSRYKGNSTNAYNSESLLKDIDGSSKPPKRPVSSKQMLENDKRRSRPKSSKPSNGRVIKFADESNSNDASSNDNLNGRNEEKVQLEDIETNSEIERELNVNKMSVTVRKTDMNDFVDELKNMEKMEEELKKSTYALQKKLGIMTEGMIL
ncbi:DgyrCDS2392 [Dimorphilus gyrociliatus]|uniref:DgyrCDS2392 n=1 Tax=Dimorphilus gyrociliatus TaxID=2664684 RepID=A0A7I8VCY2_9ANNE|nr:DgyrCDS2392 [Dimorphilus gyrociliatus]